MTGRKPRYLESTDRNAELERLLVQGELVTDHDGKQTRVYPNGQEVAKRLGISAAWVSKFARKHRCHERRAVYQAKVQEKVQERLIQAESKRLAFDTERTLSLCDKVLGKFEELLDERGVGNFSVADMNTIVRLRRYLQGDADSRQEVASSINLDTLQVAHRDMMRRLNGVSAEECGLEPERTQHSKGPPELPLVESGGKSKINRAIN